MLLRYFGEKNEHNCGQCDVCLNKHHSGIKQGEFQELEKQIKQLLQANAMPVSELLNQLNSNREKAEKGTLLPTFRRNNTIKKWNSFCINRIFAIDLLTFYPNRI